MTAARVHGDDLTRDWVESDPPPFRRERAEATSPGRGTVAWAGIAPAPRREPDFDDEVVTPQLALLGRDAPLLPFAEVRTAAPAVGDSPDRGGRKPAVPAIAPPPGVHEPGVPKVAPPPGVRVAQRSGGSTDRVGAPGRPTDEPLSRATRREALPDPARFGRQFVQGVLEVFSGRRPAGQLAASASMGVHAGLARDLLKGDRLGLAGGIPVLHSIRVMEPADGVAELCAVVRIGPRYRAIAARLEGVDGRWRCVRLQIG